MEIYSGKLTGNLKMATEHSFYLISLFWLLCLLFLYESLLKSLVTVRQSLVFLSKWSISKSMEEQMILEGILLTLSGKSSVYQNFEKFNSYLLRKTY